MAGVRTRCSRSDDQVAEGQTASTERAECEQRSKTYSPDHGRDGSRSAARVHERHNTTVQAAKHKTACGVPDRIIMPGRFIRSVQAFANIAARSETSTCRSPIVRNARRAAIVRSAIVAA